MHERNIVVATADGRMDAFIAYPDGPGPFAPVVMYQNVSGLSESMRGMARRVAAEGYYCAVPDLYYRLGKIVIDADSEASDVQAIRKIAIASLKNRAVMADTQALLEEISRDPLARPRPGGVVGYCMGGRYSLLAAAHFPEVFKACASLFGTGLVTEASDSPHRLVSRIQGEVYCGFAEHDPLASPQVVAQIEAGLKQSDATSLVETHPGTTHGYAFPGRPCYQEQAAEKSWQRIFEMFRRQL